MDSYSAETFSPLVGETFRLQREQGAPVELVLAEVSGGGRSFSIVLVGPAAERLPQRIYRLEHARLGSLDLFLVPIGQTAAGVQYEAVFS